MHQSQREREEGLERKKTRERCVPPHVGWLRVNVGPETFLLTRIREPRALRVIRSLRPL